MSQQIAYRQLPVEMEKKLNCWEYMLCGREPGGIEAEELGVCPAATDTRFDGVNGGCAAGRVCWAVMGTLCSRKREDLFANERERCDECPFFLEVEEQEEGSLVRLPMMIWMGQVRVSLDLLEEDASSDLLTTRPSGRSGSRSSSSHMTSGRWRRSGRTSFPRSPSRP